MLVVFQAANKQFCIDMPIVQSIQSAGLFLGDETQGLSCQKQLEVKGQKITLLDLSCIFGGQKPWLNQIERKVLLVKRGDHFLGLLVDRVEGILDVKEDSMSAIPMVMRGPAAQSFPRVVRRGDSLILMIDPVGLEQVEQQTPSLAQITAEAEKPQPTPPEPIEAAEKIVVAPSPEPPSAPEEAGAELDLAMLEQEPPPAAATQEPEPVGELELVAEPDLAAGQETIAELELEQLEPLTESQEAPVDLTELALELEEELPPPEAEPQPVTATSEPVVAAEPVATTAELGVIAEQPPVAEALPLDEVVAADTSAPAMEPEREIDIYPDLTEEDTAAFSQIDTLEPPAAERAPDQGEAEPENLLLDDESLASLAAPEKVAEQPVPSVEELFQRAMHETADIAVEQEFGTHEGALDSEGDDFWHEELERELDSSVMAGQAAEQVAIEIPHVDAQAPIAKQEVHPVQESRDEDVFDKAAWQLRDEGPTEPPLQTEPSKPASTDSEPAATPPEFMPVPVTPEHEHGSVFHRFARFIINLLSTKRSRRELDD